MKKFTTCIIPDGGSMSLVTTTKATVYEDRIEIYGECNTTIYREKSYSYGEVLRSDKTKHDGWIEYSEKIRLGDNVFYSSHGEIGEIFQNRNYDQVINFLENKHKEEKRKDFYAFLVFLFIVALVVISIWGK